MKQAVVEIPHVNTLRECVVPFLLLFLGASFFIIAFGTRILDGTWTGWLYTSKRMQYEAAWLAYRNASWSFPLGHLPQFFYPIGSSIAYMDGAPWYLTFLKIIQVILPAGFSAWGTWILICCLLQAITAFYFMKVLTKDLFIVWIGTILLTVNPVLVERSVHFALLAQWLLLFSWLLFFRDQRLKSTEYLWLVLIGLVAGIHPYLSAMVLPIRFGALLIERISWKDTAIKFISSLVVLLLVQYIFGYFSNGSTNDEGVDVYTADILTFINGAGSSTLLPSFFQAPGESEGYGYLGLGGILLVGYGVFRFFSNIRNIKKGSLDTVAKKVIIALAVGILLSCYALGPHIKYAGLPIISNPFYFLFSFGKLKQIPLIFRMPGRFIWPLYYLCLALGCCCLREKKLLLVGILATQYIDIGNYIAAKHPRFASGLIVPELSVYQVSHLISTSKKIDFIPLEPRNICGFQPNSDAQYMLIALLPVSAKLGIPMNSGMQARAPSQLIQPQCKKYETIFERGDFDDDTAYIVDSDLVPKQYFNASNRFSCRRFNKTSICGQFHYDFTLNEDRVKQLRHFHSVKRTIASTILGVEKGQ